MIKITDNTAVPQLDRNQEITVDEVLIQAFVP